MKPLTTIIILTLFSLQSYSQNEFKVREHIAPAATIFMAGVFEGTMDIVDNKYWKFKKVFPGANDQFWDADHSYKNRRGEYFPFVRDGWHLLKFGNHLMIASTVTLKIGEKKKWYGYIIEALSYWAINRAGFHLSYGLIFKGNSK